MIHRHLEHWWYLWSMLRQLVLIYPVYAIMMLESGITPTDLALLFSVWSATALVAETPAGILADRLPRRPALIAGAFCKGLGFACWIAYGDFTAYLAGFVAWGLGGALTSGAREALLFESLQDDDRSDAFQSIYGRGEALSRVSVATSFILGGLAAELSWTLPLVLSALSMIATAVLIAVAFREPRCRTPRESAGLGEALRELRTTPGVLPLVAATGLLTCTHGTLDEFVPPVLDGAGFAASEIGVLLASIALAEAAGMAIASRLPQARGLTVPLATYLVGAFWLLLTLIDHPAALLVGIAGFFVAGGCGEVSLMSALQHSQRGDARATTTSLAALATEVNAIPLYLAGGLLADYAGWGFLPTGFAFATAMAAGALGLAVLWSRRSAHAPA